MQYILEVENIQDPNFINELNHLLKFVAKSEKITGLILKELSTQKHWLLKDDSTAALNFEQAKTIKSYTAENSYNLFDGLQNSKTNTIGFVLNTVSLDKGNRLAVLADLCGFWEYYYKWLRAETNNDDPELDEAYRSYGDTHIERKTQEHAWIFDQKKLKWQNVHTALAEQETEQFLVFLEQFARINNTCMQIQKFHFPQTLDSFLLNTAVFKMPIDFSKEKTIGINATKTFISLYEAAADLQVHGTNQIWDDESQDKFAKHYNQQFKQMNCYLATNKTLEKQYGKYSRLKTRIHKLANAMKLSDDSNRVSSFAHLMSLHYLDKTAEPNNSDIQGAFRQYHAAIDSLQAKKENTNDKVVRQALTKQLANKLHPLDKAKLLIRRNVSEKILRERIAKDKKPTSQSISKRKFSIAEKVDNLSKSAIIDTLASKKIQLKFKEKIAELRAQSGNTVSTNKASEKARELELFTNKLDSANFIYSESYKPYLRNLQKSPTINTPRPSTNPLSHLTLWKHLYDKGVLHTSSRKLVDKALKQAPTLAK